ncbi:MAG: sulfatase-like hydrolase/transferase, partial [Opitutales bacterium]|nr:sulfatase-like hydrolase/transferase [Opitutales bacterium]
MKNFCIPFLVLGFVIGCADSESDISTEKPGEMNVLFIIADDLRPDLGVYGDKIAVTPHLDRLASQSVVFNRAYCQKAVCWPS